MARIKARRKKVIHKAGVSEDLPIPDDTRIPENEMLVVEEVPVKTPTESVTNWATLATALASGAAVVAGVAGLPIDKAGIVTIFSAIGLIGSLVAWARNRWFRNTVISTSVEPSELKTVRRIV